MFVVDAGPVDFVLFVVILQSQDVLRLCYDAFCRCLFVSSVVLLLCCVVLCWFVVVVRSG